LDRNDRLSSSFFGTNNLSPWGVWQSVCFSSAFGAQTRFLTTHACVEGCEEGRKSGRANVYHAQSLPRTTGSNESCFHVIPGLPAEGRPGAAICNFPNQDRRSTAQWSDFSRDFARSIARCSRVIYKQKIAPRTFTRSGSLERARAMPGVPRCIFFCRP
jgi:hypothetical protein